MKKILLSLMVLGATAFGANAQVQGYSVGQTVTDFTITDIDGNTHTLSDYTNAGKWVVLDFFFVTCPPCQATAPIFNELHEKYGCNAADLVCLSVSIQGNTDAQVIDYESNYGGTFSHAPAISGEGGGGNVDNDFNPSAYPTYCLINNNMQLVNADIWPINSVADFEAAFSTAGFSPAETACSAVSAQELTLTNAQVFPNPSNGNVSIRFSNTVSSDVTIQVSNLVGQVVYTSTETSIAGSNSFDLNLTDLTEGQYIVKIGNGTEQAITKVQITK